MRPAARSTNVRRDPGVRAVTRALDLLIELGTWDRPATLTELARRVDLHPTTALRLLDSLRARGFVRQLTNRAYVLGARNFEIGSAYLRNVTVWSQANQLADELAAATEETASVGVLDSGQILYIAIARGQQDMGIASAPGTRHPVYCTALGKAILADLPGEQVLEILRKDPPVRLTPSTLASVPALQRDLAVTRRRGFSIDKEERTPGVVCVGAAIRDHKGDPVGALSISGPAQRMRKHGIDRLGEIVSKTASTYLT